MRPFIAYDSEGFIKWVGHAFTTEDAIQKTYDVLGNKCFFLTYKFA